MTQLTPRALTYDEVLAFSELLITRFNIAKRRYEGAMATPDADLMPALSSLSEINAVIKSFSELLEVGDTP